MKGTIQLLQVTPEELKNEILCGIKEHLSRIKKDSPPPNQTEYLSRTDVAKMLQINLSTLYHWTKKGKLLAYGLGGRVYYKREEVEAAIIKLNN